MVGRILRSIKSLLKANSFLRPCYLKTKDACYRFLLIFLGDKKLIELRYNLSFGKKLNLQAPKTMNEKIQWLKLYDRKDIYTTLADKYAVREWLAKRFGKEYLIPLPTTDYRDIKPENIPDVPCIIKTNHSCGTNFICKDKHSVDWAKLRRKCKRWLKSNFYYNVQEWQYKNIPPRIIVEKLLLTHEGKLPNDYKLEFFNGRLEFVYCSIDREGENFRNIYSADWKPLNFAWGGHPNRGPEIEPPVSFPKMVEIGSKIARMFRYVRVDFYDVDGKLYYGEITLHHGSGYDHFSPDSWDLYWGEKLDLNAPVEDDVQ